MPKYSWRELSPDSLPSSVLIMETCPNWGISFLCFYLGFEIRFHISGLVVTFMAEACFWRESIRYECSREATEGQGLPESLMEFFQTPI